MLVMLMLNWNNVVIFMMIFFNFLAHARASSSGSSVIAPALDSAPGSSVIARVSLGIGYHRRQIALILTNPFTRRPSSGDGSDA